MLKYGKRHSRSSKNSRSSQRGDDTGDQGEEGNRPKESGLCLFFVGVCGGEKGLEQAAGTRG